MPAAARPNKKRKPKSAAPKRAAPALVDTLAAAAWSEADGALAEALAEFDGMIIARTEAARKGAAALLEQALTRAARRRGLTRFGSVGGAESYDPARHELPRAPARAPKRVRVKVRGVARGAEVLIKARVGLVRVKRR